MDITETNVCFGDVYAETADLIDEAPVREHVATATELPWRFARDTFVGVDPRTVPVSARSRPFLTRAN